MALEQRFEGRERVSLSILLEKSILEMENRQSKGPEDKTYLIYPRKTKKIYVATA